MAGAGGDRPAATGSGCSHGASFFWWRRLATSWWLWPPGAGGWVGGGGGNHWQHLSAEAVASWAAACRSNVAQPLAGRGCLHASCMVHACAPQHGREGFFVRMLLSGRWQFAGCSVCLLCIIIVLLGVHGAGWLCCCLVCMAQRLRMCGGMGGVSSRRPRVLAPRGLARRRVAGAPQHVRSCPHHHHGHVATWDPTFRHLRMAGICVFVIRQLLHPGAATACELGPVTMALQSLL